MAVPVDARFVLVRPANALNIGAAARAMANFGLDDLVAVSPYDPRWREAQSAIYASDLLAKARLVTLEEATADCHLVLGTASLHNRALVRTAVTLTSLGPWLKRRLPDGGRVAVLFGSEKNGLDNGEMSHCHAILRIPTVPEAPSMNLGQAVALVAYGLVQLRLERSVKEPEEPLPEKRQMEELVETAMRAMARVRVNAHMSEAARREKVRSGLLRWRMTRGDAAWLKGLLARLAEPPK